MFPPQPVCLTKQASKQVSKQVSNQPKNYPLLKQKHTKKPSHARPSQAKPSQANNKHDVSHAAWSDIWYMVRYLLMSMPWLFWGRYHGSRRPSSDDSFSQSNRHSTIGTRQTKYHEALQSSVNVQSHLTSSFGFMILGLSSADGRMAVGLWKLSPFDGRRLP